jgi:hypothetical protein
VVLEISTARDSYRIIEAAPADVTPDAIVLTLAFERADGIERVVFRCRLDSAFRLVNPGRPALGLRSWLERAFDAARPSKSIRGLR